MADENLTSPGDNPFYFEADVDVSNLRKSLSKAEESYLEMSKAVMKLVDGLEDQSAMHKKAGDDAKKGAGDEERAQKKRWQFLSKQFDREKDAVGDLGVTWGKFRDAIGGFAIIGGIAALTAALSKAASAYLEFDSVLRSVDSSIKHQPKLMKAASASISEWRGHLGMSEEDIARVVSGIGQLHIVTGNMPKAAGAFKGLVDQAIFLSKALDVSTETTIEFYRSWIKVYNLPHHRLRNIGSAMKHIQEQTGISGDELMRFGQGLTDLLAKMGKTSKNAKSRITADMMAVAGALTKMGIEPEKMSSMFEEALKLDSAKGAEWMAFITRQTGEGADKIRSMLEAGDVETPMLLFQRALKKLGPRNLKLAESYYSDLFGMSYGQMTRMMEENEDGMKELFTGTRKAYKQGQLHAKRTAELEAPITKAWIDLKNSFMDLWRTIGRGVVGVATKVAKYLFPWIKKATVWVNKWLDSWLSSDKGITDWFKNVWTWMKTKIYPVLTDVGKAFKWVGQQIGKLIDWYQGLTGTEKDIVKWAAAIGVALMALSSSLGPIGIAIVGVVAGAKALADEISEITGQADRMRRTQADIKWNKDMAAKYKGQSAWTDTKSRVLGMTLSGKEGMIAELQRFMAEGIITKEGTVNIEHPLFDGDIGKAKWFQKEIQKNITKGGELEQKAFGRTWTPQSIFAEALQTYKGMSPEDWAEKEELRKGGLSADTAKPARVAPTPLKVPKAPKIAESGKAAPIVVKTAGEGKQEAILEDIRDNLKDMNVRSASKRGAHPARAVVEEPLGG